MFGFSSTVEADLARNEAQTKLAIADKTIIKGHDNKKDTTI